MTESPDVPTSSPTSSEPTGLATKEKFVVETTAASALETTMENFVPTTEEKPSTEVPTTNHFETTPELTATTLSEGEDPTDSVTLNPTTVKPILITTVAPISTPSQTSIAQTTTLSTDISGDLFITHIK